MGAGYAAIWNGHLAWRTLPDSSPDSGTTGTWISCQARPWHLPRHEKSPQQCTSSAWKVTKVRKGTSNASAGGGSTSPQQLMRFWLSRNQGELWSDTVCPHIADLPFFLSLVHTLVHEYIKNSCTFNSWGRRVRVSSGGGGVCWVRSRNPRPIPLLPELLPPQRGAFA